MRKLLVILLLVVGGITLDRVDVTTPQSGVECNISDLHHEQLCCNHRYNLDAEHTSTLVIPSVRTITTVSTRTLQQRILALSFVENHQTITNYSVARFVWHLGSFARAIDLYLYIFCVLRL